MVLDLAHHGPKLPDVAEGVKIQMSAVSSTHLPVHPGLLGIKFNYREKLLLAFALPQRGRVPKPNVAPVLRGYIG